MFSLQASAPAAGSILSFCAWLEQSSVGVLVRESLWGFQIVVAIHIFGLILSVGTLVWFDLRLLGVSMRRVPVSEVYRQLAPWSAVGFVTMFVTGSMLHRVCHPRLRQSLFPDQDGGALPGWGERAPLPSHHRAPHR